MKILVFQNNQKKMNVLEFLPEENSSKREETIVCVYSWEGRGTNCYKFNPKLKKMDFVFWPRFPQIWN